jgi:hypothetical protein
LRGLELLGLSDKALVELAIDFQRLKDLVLASFLLLGSRTFLLLNLRYKSTEDDSAFFVPVISEADI